MNDKQKVELPVVAWRRTWIMDGRAVSEVVGNKLREHGGVYEPLVTLASAKSAISRNDTRLWLLLDEVAEDYELQGLHDLEIYTAVRELRDSLPKPTRKQIVEFHAVSRAAVLARIGEKGNG